MGWVFIILLALGVPIWIAIWLITRVVQSTQRLDELSKRVEELEIELVRLRSEPPATPAAEAKPAADSQPEETPTAPPLSVESLLRRREAPAAPLTAALLAMPSEVFTPPAAEPPPEASPVPEPTP